MKLLWSNLILQKNLAKLLSGSKDNKSLETEIMEEFIKNVELLLEQIFLRLVKTKFL